MRRPDDPLLVVLVVTSLLLGVVFVGQMLTQRDLYFVNKFGLGVDYREVHRAAANLRAGRNPYDAGRYVYPPLPALVAQPLARWPFDVVKRYVPLAVLLSTLTALFLLHRTFNARDPRTDIVFLLASTGVVALSYPFHFLFDRANLDGFALCATAAGIHLLRRSEWLAGVLIATGVAIKLYPILVVIPLALRLRWRPLVAIVLTLGAMVAITPELWLGFVQDRMLSRGAQFRIDENGSLASTLFHLGRFLGLVLGARPWQMGLAASGAGNLLWAVFLGALVLADALVADGDRSTPVSRADGTGSSPGAHDDGDQATSRSLAAAVTLYFPFMVAVPKLAYHYELIWLIAMLPAIGWLAIRTSDRAQQALLWLIVIGISLGQFHAVAAQRVLDSFAPQFVPGFGLLLVILGVVALRWHELLSRGGLRAGLDRLRIRLLPPRVA